MAKSKFRTLYDTQGYEFMEKGGGEDMTDGSEYVPTEKLVMRFLSGAPVTGIEPIYTFNSNPEDVHAVTQEFAHAEAEENFQEQVSQLGAEGLRRLQQDTVKKINQKPKAKAKSEESTHSPSKDFEEVQDGKQGGKTPAQDKPSASPKGEYRQA